MSPSLRDVTPKNIFDKNKEEQIFEPQVEKTGTILPIDQQNIEPVAAEVRIESTPKGFLAKLLYPFKKMGPGLITGASDDDPSGIGTYSVAGVQFGYQTLFMALVTYPLSAAVQEVCARIGLVTGHGLAAVTKKYYGRWVLVLVALLLVVANTINIGADIQAMAATLQLLIPSASFSSLAVGLTLLILFILIVLPYRTVANILKYTASVLLVYVLVAFLSNVDWPKAIQSLLIPQISLNPAFIMTTVGILGTTISPYMFFWQANEEVEEEISKGIIRKDDPTSNHPQLLKLDRRVIKDMYWDVNLGMFYSEVIMFFIILATAANLSTGNIAISDLSLAQLANVLRPLVGDTAFLLFAIGIIGIGLLAIPVLAGSASYAISELFDWKEGLNKKFHEAKGFYAVIIIATLVGLSLNFTGISPISALYYTAVINGVVAAPLLIVIWKIGNNKKIVGEHTSGWFSNILVLATIAIMGLAAILMFTVK